MPAGIAALNFSQAPRFEPQTIRLWAVAGVIPVAAQARMRPLALNICRRLRSIELLVVGCLRVCTN
jgi:hypothetical protein